jgi:hypothetical protein
MEINTLTRTPGAIASSRVLVAGGRWRAAVDLEGRGDTCASGAKPAAAFQGGAIAVTGMAPVTPVVSLTPMVTDHFYSTRPGSPSCSPPV